MLPRSTLERFPKSALERTTRQDTWCSSSSIHSCDAMLLVNILVEGCLHEALTPPYLHGIPAREWHLPPWPPMHNPQHVKVCKQPYHAVRLHIDLPVDGRPLTARHLVHPLHPTAPPPPPPPRLLCSLCPCFRKRLMLSEMSPRNIANPNGLMFCNMVSTSCSRLSRYHDDVPTLHGRRKSRATATQFNGWGPNMYNRGPAAGPTCSRWPCTWPCSAQCRGT